MYAAVTGKNYRLKQFLAKSANMDLQTTAPGPLIDFKVPKRYTTDDLDIVDGEDTSLKGLT